MSLQSLEEINFLLERLIALYRLLCAVDTAVEYLKVGEYQLKVDGLDIPCGADAAVNVDYVIVLEAADNVHDGVHLADIGKELVAKTLALGSPLYKAGNVHELQRSRSELLRIVHFGELVKTLVRNGYYADVRLNGAERIVRGLCACVCECVEKGALADIRQTYHA